MAIPASSGTPSTRAQETPNVIPYPGSSRVHAHARATTYSVTPTSLENNSNGDNNNYYYKISTHNKSTFNESLFLFCVQKYIQFLMINPV